MVDGKTTCNRGNLTNRQHIMVFHRVAMLIVMYSKHFDLQAFSRDITRSMDWVATSFTDGCKRRSYSLSWA